MATDHDSQVSVNPQDSDAHRDSDEAPTPADSLQEPAQDTPDTGGCESTGSPTGTAPRAVLRPVPAEFPTPPPRPARPNRAPALPQAELAPPRQQPRYLVPLIASISVFLLVLGTIAGVTAFRVLSGGAEPKAGESPSTEASEDEPAPAASQGTAPLVLGEITVSEVSTQTEVGEAGAVQPDGEYIVVTLEILNESDRIVIITSTTAQLTTSDGQVHDPVQEASEALSAQTEPRGTADPGDTVQIHAVFDVPADSEPVAVHIDLSNSIDDAEGLLSLGG